MKHKDGYWVWVWDRGQVLEWDKEGKPLKMYGIQQDISTEKLWFFRIFSANLRYILQYG